MAENTKNLKEIMNESYDEKIKDELVRMGFSGGLAEQIIDCCLFDAGFREKSSVRFILHTVNRFGKVAVP